MEYWQDESRNKQQQKPGNPASPGQSFAPFKLRGGCQTGLKALLVFNFRCDRHCVLDSLGFFWRCNL